VKLFLDAHVSGRRIATSLREQHDVRAADEERELDGWEDEQLLALATDEGRVMVTFNVGDFARITTEWAAAGTSHAGCLLIVGIDHAEFGLILRVIEHALSTRPDQTTWIDYTAWGTRAATP
jgi:Domain of unknown function (DUF5615)